MTTSLDLLALAVIVGAGINAGAFFAFSTFVMPALATLSPRNGAEAMQAINRAAPTPPFMLALFGTGVLALIPGIASVDNLGTAAGWCTLAGALAYLNVIVLTAVVNVPLNNSLEATDAAGSRINEVWSRYQRVWNRANHGRTLLSIAAMALFTIGQFVG